MDGFLQNASELVSQTGKICLGSFPHIMIATIILAPFFLRDAPQQPRKGNFVLLILGSILFGYSSFTIDNEQAFAVTSETSQSSPLDQTLTQNGDSRPEEKGSITIAGRKFLEQSILVELMAQVIESMNPHIEVHPCYHIAEDAVNLFSLIKRGDIDVYPEYTGTFLAHTLSRAVVKDRQVREPAYHKPNNINGILAKRRETENLKWLEPFGFNNIWGLVMLKAKAKRLGNILTISALRKFDKILRLKITFAFLNANRLDGLHELETKYALQFKNPSAISHKDKYLALLNGEIDLTDGYGTDPQLHETNSPFLRLEDDEHFFPPYYAAPVVTKHILQKFTGVEPALNRLAGQITKKDMGRFLEKGIAAELDRRDLNEDRKARGQLQRLVDEFLRSKGLIHLPLKPEKFKECPLR